MAVEQGWTYKPGYPVPEQLIDQARWLRDQNLSFARIARELGIAKSTVGKYLKGEGESFYEMTCDWCGAELISVAHPHRRWCNSNCQHSYRWANDEAYRIHRRVTERDRKRKEKANA